MSIKIEKKWWDKHIIAIRIWCPSPWWDEQIAKVWHNWRNPGLWRDDTVWKWCASLPGLPCSGHNASWFSLVTTLCSRSTKHGLTFAKPHRLKCWSPLECNPQWHIILGAYPHILISQFSLSFPGWKCFHTFMKPNAPRLTMQAPMSSRNEMPLK